MNKILTTLLFFGGLTLMSAQWSKATPNIEVTKKSDNSVYYKLDISAIRSQLSAADKVENPAGTVTVSMPTIDGKIEKFAVNSFPVMDEALANQYQLGSYVGVGIDDPMKSVRFSVAPNDFQSMVISNGKYEFIEPATADKAFYSVHGKSSKNGHAFVCTTNESRQARNQMEELQNASDQTAFVRRSGNQKLRTLRVAISTTGEYTTFFGGLPGALAQINATLTRVNGVFEQEFNVHLNMINNTQIIFTDPATDPYATVTSLYAPPTAWNTQLMNTLHGTTYGVGDAAFDIGHLFGATGGGGNAGCIGCVCNNSLSISAGNADDSYKGAGITSPGVDYYASGTFNSNSTTQLPPSGDAYDIDYVAHEMGHQLGDSHTYSFYETYLNKEMEPGSGTTIMGYAGITGTTTDVQHHSDPYFHTASIEQVQANLLTGLRATCGTTTAIANKTPVVTAMPTTYTIPKGTAFVLTAVASDPDGDAITYCWEEIDPSKLANGVTKTNIGTTTSGASFRSWPPTDNPTRYFPKLSTVLSGVVKNTTDFEAASTVARTTNFRVTVRDNKGAGQAQTAFANQVIVVGAAAPFTVSTTSLSAGTNSTINWVPSGTTASPYNVANVKIDFTSDSGATWITLAESVANNGTASVFVPAELSGKSGHIRVSAIGNVFYAVKAASVGTLAVSDVNNTKSVQIFPNPVKDILNVSNISANATYEIYNATGQIISKGNLATGKVSVNKLTKGIYFINVDDKGTIVKTKFIKE